MTAILAMAEAWGLPPWQIEKECSVFWADAFADYVKWRAFEAEKAQRQVAHGTRNIPQGLY